ncbi:MAG: 16S rRNA (guanine(527)-N(7))-methyltransferase RsmG [Elusimicrobiota bacterium]|jgi:16S rRNA (guanine527-N7)-methyltransferase|nr:16S rRNA (guanine(527)-N(7))-methyltransferase RsmG [Elusimicrobiota bacterium]
MNDESLERLKTYIVKNIIPELGHGQFQKLAQYFDEIVEWNRKLNLISFKDDNDLIYRHFCDSLYAVKLIKTLSQKKQIKIADIGTGAGMPGIPIKIVLPDINLSLIESITKKCKFLENVKDRLKLDFQILNIRAEEIGVQKFHRQKYDFVLSRAVSKLSPNLELAIPLLKVGGYFIVYKTKNSILSKEEGLPSVENALKLLEASLEKVLEYNLPQQNFVYCLLAFKKNKETPFRFPRKTGIPQKEPL